MMSCTDLATDQREPAGLEPGGGAELGAGRPPRPLRVERSIPLHLEIN